MILNHTLNTNFQQVVKENFIKKGLFFGFYFKSDRFILYLYLRCQHCQSCGSDRVDSHDRRSGQQDSDRRQMRWPLHRQVVWDQGQMRGERHRALHRLDTSDGRSGYQEDLSAELGCSHCPARLLQPAEHGPPRSEHIGRTCHLLSSLAEAYDGGHHRLTVQRHRLSVAERGGCQLYNQWNKKLLECGRASEASRCVVGLEWHQTPGQWSKQKKYRIISQESYCSRFQIKTG